jgi:archaemetzincin
VRRLAFAALLLLTAAPRPAEAKPGRVYVVALGEVPDALVAEVSAALQAEYVLEVVRLPPVPLPAQAYHQPRRRYRAEKLLVFLNGLLPRDAGPGARILGLTAADISTSKPPHADWGVFGLGEIGGRACVVSSFRLRRRARGPAQVAFRVRSTAVHEVGHTLGLPHCDEPRCVMLDAEGSIRNTDTGTGRLGPGCRRQLAGQVR